MPPLLRLGLFALAALTLSLPLSADDTARRTITVLHTNDLHGHLLPWEGWGELAGRTLGGLDRIAAAVTHVRATVGTDRVLLLDGGDTLADTLIAKRTEGRAIIAAMNAIGYDAMVIGNHEPDYTAKVLRERIAEARFPVLAANIVDARDGSLYTTPYTVRTVNGVRVGVLGIAYPNTPDTTSEKNIEGLAFRGAVESARVYLPRLRAEGAELVIVLSHYGLGADRKLARAVPGIDVIVGGHSHNRMHDAMREGATLIVQAGAHGSDLGRLDLDVENGRVVGYRRELLLMDNDYYAPDPEVAAVITAMLRPHQRELDETVGEAAGLIVRAQTMAGQEPRERDQQSPADSLFADILRRQTGADVALRPGIGYGVALRPGPIRASELRNLIPHAARVVTLTLTGAQILDILEQSLENVYTDEPSEKVGGIVQVSGLSFEYDRAAPQGERVIEVRIGDDALDAARAYRVATNSLLAAGGHKQRTFLAATDRQEGKSEYELVRSALAGKRVEAPDDLRIVEAPGAGARVSRGHLPFFEPMPCTHMPADAPAR